MFANLRKSVEANFYFILLYFVSIIINMNDHKMITSSDCKYNFRKQRSTMLQRIFNSMLNTGIKTKSTVRISHLAEV